ncbi:MAG: DUF3747 domain-containing protein [Synechococcaceae cyanobacterium]|nr:DUF3747 domain-containing protein [Synechococcaceae cyanobacterium]
MRRTYLLLAGLALAGASGTVAAPSLVRAAALFNSRPVASERFAILARAVGDGEWNLLVLEQLRTRPLCWQKRPDGLIDPSLNRFDYSGICSRYLDSNGYSVRINGEDLASSARLRLQQQGSELLLQSYSADLGEALVVGRGTVPRRDRDGFVAIELDNGWSLERRTFGNQTLNHVYFANATPLPQLIARARGGAESGGGALVPGLALSNLRGVRSRGLTAATGPQPDPAPIEPGRTIALQVIPFQE